MSTDTQKVDVLATLRRHLEECGVPGCNFCTELDACITAVAELIEQNKVLRAGIEAVSALIDESHGIYGLHRNGDPASWDELRSCGRFEEWLVPFDAALARVGGAA